MCGGSERASVARKTAAITLDVATPVRAKTYADYPAVLTTYKWLVEDGLRHPERMFNTVSLGELNAYACKACGAAYRKGDFAAHVNEHAEQLRLSGRVGVTRGGEIINTSVPVIKVSEELKLTIIDALAERLPDLELAFTLNHGLLGDKLARAINDVSKDGGASTPHLCADCEGQ